MRRRIFDRLAATGGLIVAAVLLVAGSFLMWGHNFVDSQVHSELSAQQITFPAKGSAGISDPAIAPYLNQYAGQLLVDGDQAKAFADHYIAVHLLKSGGGQTYSELSAKAQADPTNTALAAQVETMFKGETLRGMLLNAYAFAKMGQIALYGAIAGFVGAALMLMLSLLGFRHERKAAPAAELFHSHAARVPAKA